jgi:glucose uptake protein
MIVPTTHIGVLLVSIASLLLLGGWANTFKATGGKWRFELYCFDFAIGVILAATFAAFTFGSLGTELSFVDNLAVTGRRQIGFGVVAGAVFNFGNMLLLGGISVAGMTTAFILSAATTVSVTALLAYVVNTKESGLLLTAGVCALALACVVVALALKAYRQEKNPGRKKLGVVKGVAVSVASGLLMAGFPPLVGLSRSGDIGLGAYAIAFSMSLGILFSTFVLNIYFMNLPLEGQALTFGSYFRGNLRMHLLGLTGGLIWTAGAICAFLAATPGGNPQDTTLAPVLANLLAYSPVIVAALCGLVIWKEFEGASARVKTLVAAALAATVAGVVLVSLSPLFAK